MAEPMCEVCEQVPAVSRLVLREADGAMISWILACAECAAKIRAQKADADRRQQSGMDDG